MKAVFCGISAISALVVLNLATITASARDISARLNGAWAESDENCRNAFVMKRGRWGFREPRDMFGSSFIISGRRYEGPFGVCRLSSISGAGDRFALNLACHNSIGYSNQVTPVRIVSATMLEVTSLAGMTISYKKCAK
jgi:hypothetical protein